MAGGRSRRRPPRRGRGRRSTCWRRAAMRSTRGRGRVRRRSSPSPSTRPRRVRTPVRVVPPRGRSSASTTARAPRRPRGPTCSSWPAASRRGHYDWPEVVDRRNEVGGLAPACRARWPGCARRTREAGRLPLEQVLAPAIELADAGVEFDWHLVLMIARAARRDPRATPAGGAPAARRRPARAGSGYWGAGGRLDTAALAATLRRIARGGRRPASTAERLAEAIDRRSPTAAS